MVSIKDTFLFDLHTSINVSYSILNENLIIFYIILEKTIQIYYLQ